MRAPPEAKDLSTVVAWLAGKGIHAVSFSKAELKRRQVEGKKTPDFRIYRGDQHVGFCEVKSPRDERLDDQLDAQGSFAIVDRPIPIFNRISHHIARAIKQFDAVNPDRTLPNILVFINWDKFSGYSDLHEALTGYHDYDDDEGGSIRDHSQSKIAEDLIKMGMDRVDLYVWIDGATHQRGIFSRDHAFRVQICGWLGIDPADIQDR